MPDNVEEIRPMDAHDLYRALDKFFNDNERHRSVEYRWLADQVIGLKNEAYHLWANGIASFEARNHNEIAAFRLLEIEEERSKIAKADARLADEAKSLTRKTAA